MIRTREEVRAAAEADAQEFSELLDSSQSDTSGIPSQPRIDVSELDLQANVFDFEIFVDPFSEAIPGDGPPPPPPLPPCNGCGFVDPLLDGRTFLTKTYSQNIHSFFGTPNQCCVETNTVSEYDPDTCVLSCAGDGVFIGDCGSEVFFISSCSGFSCIGAFVGCNYLPGTRVEDDTLIFEFCCPDGCTEGVDCLECGITTTVFSDECTP